LDGTNTNSVNAVAGQFDFQVGKDATQTISVTIGAMTGIGLGISNLGIATAATASASLTTIDTALDTLNSTRATIGAGINRLTYATDNLTNISANVTASRSSIMDTDYATASTQLSKTQIIQQASTAMLAQANQQPQSVLALLK
jgi:flagellin